ncbi:MAG TPA: hypothetical protein VGX28_16030 [Frankiaceae bacterium]|jgi:hypothetical protein|nr:hypothetical protein [Frankiaceae bacterium]
MRTAPRKPEPKSGPLHGFRRPDKHVEEAVTRAVDALREDPARSVRYRVGRTRRDER